MAGILNDRVNLGVCKLTANLTASASSVSVDDASVFSSLGDFYATLMPSDELSRFSNSEIVKCTYVNDTTLAILRAQRGTTARAFNAGAILSNGIYTEDIDQMQSVGDMIFSTTFNSTNSTYTISSGNSYLPALPTNGMRITIKAGAANTSQAKLDLQGLGVSYNIMTGTGTNTGSVSHSTAMLKNNEVYELVFDGTQWLCTNILGGSGTSGLIGTSDIAGGAVTSSKIDWTTLGFKTSSITTQATVTMNTPYTHTPVPGLSLTLDGPVGAKYFVISTTTLKRPEGGYSDLYSMIYFNGTLASSMSVYTIGADRWTPICVSAVVQLSNTPATAQVYLQGSATGNYTIGVYSRISAIRVE